MRRTEDSVVFGNKSGCKHKSAVCLVGTLPHQYPSEALPGVFSIPFASCNSALVSSLTQASTVCC